MPSFWDEQGNLVDGKYMIIEKMLRIVDSGPNNSPSNGKIDITGASEQSLTVSGATVYLQNVGDNRVYVDIKTGVNSDKWEIPPRGKAGPITAKDKLYFLGAGVSTLKYIFVG